MTETIGVGKFSKDDIVLLMEKYLRRDNANSTPKPITPIMSRDEVGKQSKKVDLALKKFSDLKRRKSSCKELIDAYNEYLEEYNKWDKLREEWSKVMFGGINEMC